MVGKLLTNCFIVSCAETREAIIIDPGFDASYEADEIFQYIEQKGLRPQFVINTHGHPDHICGNGVVKKRFNIPVLIHEGDAPMLEEPGRVFARTYGFNINVPPADKVLHEGEEIRFGEASLKVLHTPGHSPGSICLLGEEELFTGDTLFAGSIGRVDFPYSSEKDMKNSLKRLMMLPDELTVFPGHGPTTRLGEEKQTNPFLRWL
ncbi:MBL fold metallo-hydrolase [Candidatus Bathyarchaeota archaeon]|nr:MBL fold metallo-hydrolase [Candidatus Bathyarchaeota archaeon]